MIQKIIGKYSEIEVFSFIRKKVKQYKIAYFIVAFFTIGIAILPFHFGWLKSVASEPHEAVAKVLREDGGMGTAFLISPNQLLTARHVVEGYLDKEVELSFEQAKIPFTVTATVEYYDVKTVDKVNEEYFENDIAVLRVTEIRNISPLRLGNSDDFKTGTVVIMGYGNNDWSEPDGKITSDSFHKYNSLYKLDASVNMGHSGSPVLRKDNNEVIGIVVGKPNAIATLRSQGQILSGENVVLKINQADRVIQKGGGLIRF
jgi:V8-like Glu-specific endopeptidase